VLRITATKREVPAHRVPINVTAVGEEQLRDENITDLKRLIASSPAIDAPGNSAGFADSVTVRGLNISSVSANNIEWFVRSTLSDHLDDAPLPNIGYRIKDVARVETLLGAQGTLDGGGSLGSTVRYVTNQPVFGKTEGRISTSLYQTRNGGLSNDTDGVINLPIGQDFALRIVAARLDEKGYTDRFAGVPDYLRRTATTWTPWTPKPDAGKTLYEDDWQKVDTGRVSARWRVTRDLELTLAHAQQSQLAHGTSGAQLLPASGSPDRYLAPLAFNDRTVLSPYEELGARGARSVENRRADVPPVLARSPRRARAPPRDERVRDRRGSQGQRAAGRVLRARERLRRWCLERGREHDPPRHPGLRSRCPGLRFDPRGAPGAADRRARPRRPAHRRRLACGVRASRPHRLLTDQIHAACDLPVVERGRTGRPAASQPRGDGAHDPQPRPPRRNAQRADGPP
jgi:hypothetical protein